MHHSWLRWLVIVAFAGVPALAQEKKAIPLKPADAAPVSGEKNGEKQEFADEYNERFLPRDPKVGTTVEDVAAFAEDGQPFSLQQTRGSYTVLVFGCLT